MTLSGVPVPAIPPRPPQLSLLNSAVRPTDSEGSSSEISGDQLAALPQPVREELAARRGEDWTRGIEYAPENHYPAILRDPCDQTSSDSPALAVPAVTAVASVGGGTVPAEALEYQVTAVNANGETTAAAATKITPGAIGTVRLTWNKVSNAAKYRIYGRKAGVLKVITTVGPFDNLQTAEFVDDGSKAPAGASPPGSNTTAGKGTYTNLSTVAFVPYLIVAEDSCSTWGFEERDFKGRAERLLENAKHKAMEAEFWSGTQAIASGWPNNYLTRASDLVNETPGSVPSIARGFEILQQALAGCGFGGQGMIHVPVAAVPNLLNVRRVGNLMLDMFDNIVVPGVGYPGTGPGGSSPAAGKTFMYATDLVMVREEPEPTVIPDTFEEALDRGQAGEPNKLRFRAEKFAAAYFDNACKFCCEVNLAA